MRRWILVLVAAVSLLVALGYALSRHDHPPVPPGSWLSRSGLEARYATVNGHRLRYLRVGRGPAVVLIHGFGSSIYTWKDVIPLLAEAHDVVALDLPGFGASDLPPDLSFEDLPSAVLDVVDHLGLERVSLVGSSMGGAVAAIVAAEHPDRVVSLALIDSAGFNFEVGDRPLPVRLMTSPLAPALARLPGKRLLIERSLREVFHDDRHVSDERVSEYLAASLRPGSTAALGSLLLSTAGHDRIVRDRLPGIQAPTLVVWGREDAWIPVGDAALFAEAIPDARVVVFDSCGHLPHVERAEEVGMRLREFLRDTAAHSRPSKGGVPTTTSARTATSAPE